MFFGLHNKCLTEKAEKEISFTMIGNKRRVDDPQKEKNKNPKKRARKQKIPCLPSGSPSLIRLVNDTRLRSTLSPVRASCALKTFLPVQSRMPEIVVEHPDIHPEVRPMVIYNPSGRRTLSKEEYFITKRVDYKLPSLVELCVESIRNQARKDDSIHQKAAAMLPSDIWERWFRRCAYTNHKYLSVKWMYLSGCCSSCYYQTTDPEHAKKMIESVKKLEGS